MLPEEVSESEINESIKAIKEALAEINIKRAEFKIALREIEEGIEEFNESWFTTSGYTTKKNILEAVQKLQGNSTIIKFPTSFTITADKNSTSKIV